MPSVVRAFKKLSPELRTRVEEALEKLARDASQTGRIGGKTVKTIHGASDSFHRLRIGDYRVMCDTSTKTACSWCWASCIAVTSNGGSASGRPRPRGSARGGRTPHPVAWAVH